MTLRFSQAEDTPVYSKSSADRVGRVIRLVVDARSRRIAAVHVAGRRGNAQLADWANVVGFGPDAVVIDNGDRLRSPGNDYEDRVARGRLDLRGRRVLTTAGFDIGPLTDIDFDEASGMIERLETSRARVRGTGLLAVGPYAVVVAHEAVDTPDPSTTPDGWAPQADPTD
jgi:uncharacterized protein YrrD